MEYKLTNSQKDFFYYELLNKKEVIKSKVYVLGALFIPKAGCFFEESMRMAYTEVLRRNDALRMRLVGTFLCPRQMVISLEEFPEPSYKKITGGRESILSYWENISVPDMPVQGDYLCHAEMVVGDEGAGGLIIWMHHIISDGYSIGSIIYPQLCEFYSLFCQGIAPENPKKLYSFAEYTKEEQKILKRHGWSNFVWKWKEYSKNCKKYSVPLRSRKDAFDANHEINMVSGVFCDDFSQACKEKGISDTAFFLAIAAGVFYARTNLQRFALSSQTHGRMSFAQRKTVGALLDIMFLFFDFPQDGNVGEYIANTYKKMVNETQHLAVASVLHAVSFIPNHVFSRTNGDDDAWFCLNNLRAYHSDPNAPLEILFMEQKGAVTAMDLEVKESEDGICLDTEYLEEVISKEDAKIWAAQYMKALELAVYHSDMSMGEWIQAISEVESPVSDF